MDPSIGISFRCFIQFRSKGMNRPNFHTARSPGIKREATFPEAVDIPSSLTVSVLSDGRLEGQPPAGMERTTNQWEPPFPMCFFSEPRPWEPNRGVTENKKNDSRFPAGESAITKRCAPSPQLPRWGDGALSLKLCARLVRIFSGC